MKRLAARQRSFLYHILGWTLLFAGWYYFRSGDYPIRSLAVKTTAIKVAALATLFYLTNYFLIPRLLYSKKYLLFGTLYVLAIAVVGTIKIVITGNLLAPYFQQAAEFSDVKERIYDNIIPLLLLTSTGAALKLVSDYVQSQKRLLEISKENAETELKFLKAQMNPHFLFNSLNSVYFQIDKQNSVARRTLLQFSDLLRYQLYDCNAETVDIEKEVSYLNDYISLQQIRKDQCYEVDYIAQPLSGFRIAPLLLIPFVENAFKHISHFADRPNFIRVRLYREGNSFYFESENSAEFSQRSTETRSGIGLFNVQRRLDLIYPERYRLNLDRGTDVFKVRLQLTIT